MAILSVSTAIEGSRPLLWNRFTPEMLQGYGVRREKRGSIGNDPSEWQARVLRMSDGQLYLEPSNVFGCLREAGRFIRVGKGTLLRTISATVQVPCERILIDRYLPKKLPPPNDPNAPVYLDVRMVRNPATGGRNIRYRVAARAGWRAEFPLSWDGSLLSIEQMHAVLIDAGNLVGLGDGRTIGFGRFRVTSFVVSKAEKSRVRKKAET
jgi:hypothetical protein